MKNFEEINDIAYIVAPPPEYIYDVFGRQYMMPVDPNKVKIVRKYELDFIEEADAFDGLYYNESSDRLDSVVKIENTYKWETSSNPVIIWQCSQCSKNCVMCCSCKYTFNGLYIKEYDDSKECKHQINNPEFVCKLCKNKKI